MNEIAQTVNFYILPDSDIDNRHRFVYRLVEKAFDQGLKALVIAADSEQLHSLDRFIWTAKPERFIPHDVITVEGRVDNLAPVILLTNVQVLSQYDVVPDVVIDLSYDGTPLVFSKVMLIANQHAEILANARMKYQSYVNSGIKPTVYKITKEQLAM